MLIIEPKNSSISMGMSGMLVPLPEQNSWGLRDDVPDVGVAGERPVARPGREALERQLGEELHRRFASQQRERGLAELERLEPEVRVRQVDLVKRPETCRGQ